MSEVQVSKNQHPQYISYVKTRGLKFDQNPNFYFKLNCAYFYFNNFNFNFHFSDFNRFNVLRINFKIKTWTFCVGVSFRLKL